MQYEQYARTKGKVIVPDEILSRDEFYSPVKYDRRKQKRRDSTPDYLPYWQWRLLTRMVDRPRQNAEVHYYHRRWRPWDKVKLVLTTLIAAPIVIIEIGFLLRFLLER